MSTTRYTHLVVIFREQIPTITGFFDLASAQAFFDRAAAQWSDSFLTEIIKGPFT